MRRTRRQEMRATDFTRSNRTSLQPVGSVAGQCGASIVSIRKKKLTHRQAFIDCLFKLQTYGSYLPGFSSVATSEENGESIEKTLQVEKENF